MAAKKRNPSKNLEGFLTKEYLLFYVVFRFISFI